MKTAIHPRRLAWPLGIVVPCSPSFGEGCGRRTEPRTLEKPEDFYRFYVTFKHYMMPSSRAKHARWYEREFWRPASCTPETSVL